MNTLSACLIAKHPSKELTRAVASVKPLVDEVCVAWTDPLTGSANVTGVDKQVWAWQSVIEKACEGPCRCQRGDLVDFAAARNASFELATSCHAVWIDSDDVVEAVDLRGLVPKDGEQTYSPYAHEHDDKGVVTELLWHPRVVPSSTRWAYPIHEQLQLSTSLKTIFDDRARWVHGRTRTEARQAAERNLRILMHWEKDPQYQKDMRFQFFLAHGYYDLGKKLKALPLFQSALGLAPSESDMQALICMRVAQCLPAHLAKDWAFKALGIRPDWPASFFLVARVYEALGKDAVARRFARMGLVCEAPKTLVPLDPSEAQYWAVKARTS